MSYILHCKLCLSVVIHLLLFIIADSRKNLALKETNYEPTPQGEKTESKMKAEIGINHSSEDKAQDDCVKDSQESPVALIKWLSELQRDMENTRKSSLL